MASPIAASAFNRLSQYASSPGNRVYSTVTQNSTFLPSDDRDHCQYSLRLPTEGWPGWVGLSGLVKYQDGNPRTVTHPSTNRARRRATTLIKANALPLSQTATSQWPVYQLHIIRYTAQMYEIIKQAFASEKLTKYYNCSVKFGNCNSRCT